MGHIYKRGKIYWIKYRRNGRSYYESTRSTSHDHADKLLKRREGDIANGVPVTPQIGKLTFDEALDDLLAHHRIKGRSTAKLERRIAKHVTPVFRRRRLADLTPADFTKYAAARQASGAANGTINRELAIVRRAYTLAKKNGKLLHVPHVEMLREANPRSGFFEREEIERVVSFLPEHLRPFVLFGYLTGWRLGEIRNLKWTNVDRRAGEIRLDPGTTKNKEGRTFPFTDELRALIDGLHRQRQVGIAFVFHRHGVPVTLRRPWQTACRRAGLKGRLFHDLRRSAVRNMVRDGIPERTIMQLIGHRTRSMFDRYNIVSAADLKRAADLMNARRVTATVTTVVTNTAT